MRKLRQFTQAHIFDNQPLELPHKPRHDKSPARNDCEPGLISSIYSNSSTYNCSYNSNCLRSYSAWLHIGGTWSGTTLVTRSHAHLRSSLYLPSCCTNSTPEISCGSRSGMIRLTEAV